MVWIIIELLVLIGVLGLIWVYTAPQFGKKPTAESRESYKSFQYFDGMKFENAVETLMDINMKDIPSLMKEFYFVKGRKEPEKTLPQKDFSNNDLAIHNDSNLYMRWFGHSAIYLEIDGKRLLLDPMLGEAAAPHKRLGPGRFNSKLPIDLDDLPEIDAVLFSHDHYDHLDHPTVVKIKGKVKAWFVPMGLESHLVKWGVEREKINVLQWWDEKEFEGLRLVSTPARHFSGRALTDRNSTLWTSWVIQGENHKVFFSGDGGYWDGFKRIGEKEGPFDLCLMECGAYNEKWSAIHCMPEESAQAAVDLNGRLMMPIHWGAFNLALHDWDEPAIRVSKKAKELGMPLLTPVIGEEVIIPAYVPNDPWWEGLK